MGSYGDRWLQCTYCGEWGKCLEHPLPIGTPSLLDVDGSGVLCDPCYDRGYPPHYDWVENMFGTKLGILSLATTSAITEYAYQRCADYKEQHIQNQIFFASLSANILQYPDDTGPPTACPCGNCKAIWNAWGWVCPLENGRAGLGTER